MSIRCRGFCTAFLTALTALTGCGGGGGDAGPAEGAVPVVGVVDGGGGGGSGPTPGIPVPTLALAATTVASTVTVQLPAGVEFRLSVSSKDDQGTDSASRESVLVDDAGKTVVYAVGTPDRTALPRVFDVYSHPFGGQPVRVYSGAARMAAEALCDGRRTVFTIDNAGDEVLLVENLPGPTGCGSRGGRGKLLAAPLSASGPQVVASNPVGEFHGVTLVASQDHYTTAVVGDDGNFNENRVTFVDRAGRLAGIAIDRTQVLPSEFSLNGALNDLTDRLLLPANGEGSVYFITSTFHFNGIGASLYRLSLGPFGSSLDRLAPYDILRTSGLSLRVGRTREGAVVNGNGLISYPFRSNPALNEVATVRALICGQLSPSVLHRFFNAGTPPKDSAEATSTKNFQCATRIADEIKTHFARADGIVLIQYYVGSKAQGVLARYNMQTGDMRAVLLPTGNIDYYSMSANGRWLVLRTPSANGVTQRFDLIDTEAWPAL